MMLLFKPHKRKKDYMKLLGAIQISGTGFFVYRKFNGQVLLKSGKEENIQRAVVQRMMKLNPMVYNILEHYKIKPYIDTGILKDLVIGHMNDTCRVAMGIYSALSANLKNGINEKIIREASMLHDLGKILIPSKVLNKPAKLNNKEREIMNMHSTLGYELLKTQGINEETLDLVKYHHQNLKHSGYPALKNDDKISEISVQIISTADKYSALRESRVYRGRLSKIESLLILYKEVLEGKIHKDVYKALFEYASKYDKAA